MTLVPGGITQSQACYQDNPNWWAMKQLGLSFHFKYLCDAVNGSNNVELSALLSNNVDWSNNFLPGINTLMTIGGNNFIQTYYPSAPYMLSANAARLEFNTSKAPMNNVNFRRAVAAAINPQEIVSGVYSGIVRAANPTGLLPNLDSFVDPSVVKQYGVSYSPAKAKSLLKASGYHGQALTIEVPDGWTDWMAAIQVIAQDLNRVGIKVSPIYPSYNARTSDEAKGTFDMEIINNVAASSDPWSFYDHVYQLPIGGASNEEASGFNVERFSDPAAFTLVQKAATTPTSDTAALNSIYGTLEKSYLKQVPEVPLWYNGAWFQGNDTYWKNFASSTTPSNQNVPVMWGGYLGSMTTVYALAALRPAK
jgi:peptide/nickel transport system substrate-binding protein